MKKWRERARRGFWCLLSVWKVGAYINVEINRESCALRYDGGGCAVVRDSAVGGAMVGETVEGIARYPNQLALSAKLAP
ncbi:hypothetical protein ACNKHN_02645 [Shigella flexneri]